MKSQKDTYKSIIVSYENDSFSCNYEKQKFRDLKKNEVRSAFGPPRSTLFYLEPINDKQDKVIGYTFIGGGFGHGVGLSQYGSYNLANLGWNEKKILHFYYPGTQVVPLNNSIIF